MKFDWDSWRQAASQLATTAETVANEANEKLPRLGDVAAAGSTSDPCTLADVAIASIYPPSVDAVREILQSITDQLIQESIGAYETGQLYHDIESDNTLVSSEITDLLGQTPYN